MPIVFRLALALDLFALCWERVFPAWATLLPLGGDHFTQLGALLVWAALFLELREIGKSADPKSPSAGKSGLLSLLNRVKAWLRS